MAVGKRGGSRCSTAAQFTEGAQRWACWGCARLTFGPKCADTFRPLGGLSSRKSETPGTRGVRVTRDAARGSVWPPPWGGRVWPGLAKARQLIGNVAALHKVTPIAATERDCRHVLPAASQRAVASRKGSGSSTRLQAAGSNKSRAGVRLRVGREKAGPARGAGVAHAGVAWLEAVWVPC